jgi:hypothetical protein
MRLFRLILPFEIAVVALLGALYFGIDMVRGPESEARSDAARTPTEEVLPEVTTTPLVNKRGGFAVGVPENVEATKVGPAVAMATADQALNFVIAPVEPGTMSASRSGFMRGMKQSYTDVRVTKTETKTIDGREARVTYGRALNAEKVDVRFINLVVKDTPRNFAINTFTAADTDPTFVLPRVHAVFNSFQVIE